MAASRNPICNMNTAVADARRSLAAAVERAQNRLEATLGAIADDVAVTADAVAASENRLETFDALEQERMARQERQDLQRLIEAHQCAVDNAVERTRAAGIDFARAIGAAAVAAEAALNGACRSQRQGGAPAK